jgi:hypothetical protein
MKAERFSEMSTSPAHATGNSTALLLMMAQVLERDCSAHFEQLVSQESEPCKLFQNKTTVAIDVIQSLGSAVTASKTGNAGSHGFPIARSLSLPRSGQPKATHALNKGSEAAIGLRIVFPNSVPKLVSKNCGSPL